LLLGGQGGLQVGNLLRESLGRTRDALRVETEDAVAGIDQVGDGGGEFGGEAGGGRLQECLHARRLAGESGGELRGIDGKRAVVVEVHAEAGEVGDAVVAGDGRSERGEESGLGFADGAIRFERAAAGAVGVYGELRVDVFDDGVISYADFITLLFAFFVVLYASSQVDKRKIGKLALSIQVAFQELGVFEASNTLIPLNDSEAVPFSQIQVVENTERTSDMTRFVQPMKGELSPSVSVPMKNVQAELEKALAPEIQNKVVELKARREGLIVSLREIGFYEVGSAALRPTSKDAIDRLASVLASRTEALRIEGHTDNVPIHNVRFASNWELSTARASELIKAFIEQYGFEPQRLSAAGFAEYHPVATNETADGRARNRRVDIVILNPYPSSLMAAPDGAPRAREASRPLR